MSKARTFFPLTFGRVCRKDNARVIIQADARYIPLKSESVQMICTSPRDGRFIEGDHWRPHKPHWDRAWLYIEYIERGRSSSEIALEVGCKENNIHFWLHKHNIPRRTVAEARAIKHWGSAGETNPMFGKYGSENPNYIDGSSPERQRLYVRAEGRKFLQGVYVRDGFRCRRCGAPKTKPKSLHAHHIKPWAGNPELRFNESNAVTLCRPCHSWVHSKKNTEKEFLVGR